MNIYCWIHSTYSINDKFNGTQGVDYPHPGLGEDDVRSERLGWTHHKYYQWVVFVLFLQAAMFHIPRIVWKHSEGGLMKMLVGDLTDPLMLVNKERRTERVDFIKKYFQESVKSHAGYAFKFFLCEVLALVNVVGQIYFTDRFLGYQFTSYGRIKLLITLVIHVSISRLGRSLCDCW